MIGYILTAVFALAPSSASATRDVDAVLAGSRAALALDARPPDGLEAQGSASFRGNDVPFSLTFDSRKRFVARFAGPLPYVAAFDGRQTWERDMGSTLRTTVLGERDSALLSNWSVTGDWAAEGSELRFTLAPPPPAADGGSLTLAFTVEGSPVTGTIELDASTHLPRRIQWLAGDNTTTQELSGFGAIEGIAIPTRIRQTSTQGHPLDIRLTGARPAPDHEESPYELPARPADAAFEPEAGAELEVKRAPTGHLLVHPLVGGADLGWFIFDTGAGSNVISTPVAEEAGFEAFGTVKAVGVGGATDAHYYRAPDLVLGPVTLREPTLVGIDLSFLDQYMGVRVGGVLGYELLARVVAEFDITGARIALHDPATFAREGTSWQELVLYQRHPCLTARFEGQEGIFTLDTGAAQSTVTFHAAAIERLGLLDGRSTTAANLGGVGGMVAARSGILEWFELGGLRSEAVPATFVTQAVGAFADPYLAGTIGGRLMAPFVLVFDYPNQKLGLVKRE